MDFLCTLSESVENKKNYVFKFPVLATKKSKNIVKVLVGLKINARNSIFNESMAKIGNLSLCERLPTVF